jgi:hypothetical protein
MNPSFLNLFMKKFQRLGFIDTQMHSRSITRYSPSSYTIEGTGSLHRRNRDVPPFNVSALWQHWEVRDGEHLTTDKILRPKSRPTVSRRIR